jgi:hypothetical protein
MKPIKKMTLEEIAREIAQHLAKNRKRGSATKGMVARVGSLLNEEHRREEKRR